MSVSNKPPFLAPLRSRRSLPLVVHLVYRLDFGGLETLLVECVNRMPANKYRHAVICLTNHTDFAKKIDKPDVEIFNLHKPPGMAPGVHLRLWKLLRRLKPDVLHTYNLAAIEYAFTAAMADVPVRVHAEHGRDAGDPEGKNRKHNLLRRLLVPFIDCYVPVSRDLQRWLRDVVGIPDAKNLLIDNGVDTDHFHPAPVRDAGEAREAHHVYDLNQREFVIGTVGRIQDIKNHFGLVDAFIRLRDMLPDSRGRMRLAIVGDGPLLTALREKVHAAGIADAVWLPGARTDIAEVMRGFDVFVLPSIAEGTPITILEAMATGLPVVATRVGGIPEVVMENVTGILVPASDTAALATAISTYYREPRLAAEHGASGRRRVERHSSVTATVAAYTRLYDTLCDKKSVIREPIESCVE